MLTAAQKEQWLKDLRSGEFKQGRNRLCTIINGEPHYCCLGVLAHREAIDSKIERPVENAITRKVYYFENDLNDLNGYVGILPEKLIISPAVVAMNDSGMSFSEIADWIEANVRTEG